MSRLWTTTKLKGEQTVSLERPSNGWNIRRKPVHPGEMLREEFMIPLDLSANKLASDLRVPVTRITEILKERRSVTADTALRLERFLGMSAEFWMALQREYDLQTARQAMGKQIAGDVRALRRAPQPEPERDLRPDRNLGRTAKVRKPKRDLVKQ